MNYRPTARIVLLNDDNKILLLRIYSNDESYWITPGGKIEEGEVPIETARRELYEETGIISAEFVVPHSWYYEAVLNLYGVPTLFLEHIFFARTHQLQTTVDYLNEDEKEIIKEHKWWDIQELIDSGETFYPKGLIAALKNVIYYHHRPEGTLLIER